MNRIICHFSFKKSLLVSQQRWVLSSFFEKNKLINFDKKINSTTWIQNYFFSTYYISKEIREVANCVFKDMIFLSCMWRHIRGYPQGGNTTHTNANTCKNNKLLFNFRLNQFYKMFGTRSRNVYPTLLKAEYNNRLFYLNWQLEWLQAHLFARRMARLGSRVGNFNPAILATNQTNGYTRTGAASKIGKAKKLVKTYTIGVPLLFARFIYWFKTPIGFPRIILKDEVNKKLGKKLRRKER